MSRSFLTSTRRNLKLPVLIALAGAIAGLGLGWLGREVKSRHSELPPAVSTALLENGNAPAPGSHAATPPGAGGTRMPGAAEREADAITARAARMKGVDYWLNLLGAAEKAPVSVLALLTDSLADEPAALTLLGERWAELNPSDLLAALAKKPASRLLPSGAWSVDHGCESLQKILAAEWFRRDPAALMAALDKASTGPGPLRAARTECFRHLAAADPARALNQPFGWQLDLDRIESAPIAFWARQNARQVADTLLLRWPDPNLANNFGGILTNAIAPSLVAADPAGAMDLAASADGRNPWKRELSEDLMRVWAGKDPAAAAHYLISSGKVSQDMLTEMIEPLMENWAATDAGAAMDWADQNLKGLARDLVPGALVKALGVRDPAGTAAFLNELEDGGAKTEGMRQLANLSVKGKDKAALLEAFHWMVAMPDPVMRAVAMDCGSWEIVQAAPDEVRAWLQTPRGAAAPVRLLVSAGLQMTETDGSAAMEWAAHQRPEAADEVRQQILQYWHSRNPAAAQAWVRSIPESPERAARIAFVTSVTAGGNGVDGVTPWLDSLPASDRPAIRRGLENSYGIGPTARTKMLEKYR